MDGDGIDIVSDVDPSGSAQNPKSCCCCCSLNCLTLLVVWWYRECSKLSLFLFPSVSSSSSTVVASASILSWAATPVGGSSGTL